MEQPAAAHIACVDRRCAAENRQTVAEGELLSDFQLLDDGAVTIDIVLSQVVQEAATMTNHLQKAATAVVVLLVQLQMLMGHSTLDMTRHYVNLYGADLSKDFERLNPLDNIKRAT